MFDMEGNHFYFIQRTCSRNPYFICTAVANYGFINVDFDAGTVEMTVRTPAEGEQMSHIIKY